MTTWVEARSAKDERLRRGRRFYTTDRLGKPCVICKARMPLALELADINAHPTCGPDAREFLALDAANRTSEQALRAIHGLDDEAGDR
ncbi:MAG: hypothetical protein CMH83_19605 [Nocardioides sp.]|nr:hypothetical protein [Nocardioides sp.]